MMMNKTFLASLRTDLGVGLMVMLMTLAMHVAGQDNKWRQWADISINKGWGKKWDTQVGFQFRTDQLSVGEYDSRKLVDGQLSYDITKSIRLLTEARLSYQDNKTERRYTIGVRWDKAVGALRFELPMLLQKELEFKNNSTQIFYQWSFRPEIGYNLRKKDLLFGQIEPMWRTNNQEWNWNRTRYALGYKLKLGDYHNFDVKWIWQSNYDKGESAFMGDPDWLSILSVGYGFDF